MRQVRKAIAVVRHAGNVLVFEQPNAPSIGPMLPGGTVEAHENFVTAAIRELAEETGLTGLAPTACTPSQIFDMRPYKAELHERVFVYFEGALPTGAWRHWEMHPGLAKAPELLQLRWTQADEDTDLDLCHGIALVAASASSPFIPCSRRSWTSMKLLSDEGLRHRTMEAQQATLLLEPLLGKLPSLTALSRPAVRNAVIRSMLYGCRVAAERDSYDLLDKARIWASSFDDAEVDGPLVQGLGNAEVITDDRYDDAIPLFGRTLRSHASVSEALAVLAACGCGYLIDRHAGLIQLRGAVSNTDYHRSFTISATPNTVYLDDTAAPLQMAEAILHESSHNFLNDILAARGVIIDDATFYFSPWRGTQRPASGFLHAVFVFSIVLQMLKTYSLLTPPLGGAWLDDRIHLEQVRLEHSVADVERLIRRIGIDWLERLVYDNLNRAIQATEGSYGKAK